MKIIKIIFVFLSFLFFVSFCKAGEETLINTLKKELNRLSTELKNQQYPPYFIGFELFDIQSAYLTSSFGRTQTKSTSRNRYLDIDIRVGGSQLDNTHHVSSGSFSSSQYTSVKIPLEDEELAIRNAIWNASERAYKDAVKQYRNVLTNKAVKVKDEDTSADFSIEKPSIYFEKKKEYCVDLNKWETIFNNLSYLFRENKWLLSGRINFSFFNVYKIIVNSEGTTIAQNEPSFRIFIYIQTKADDGMVLYLYKSYFGFEENELPGYETLKEDLSNLISKLKQLKDAPLMETYSGPAILSGEASGVFFHEIFGHRVEGHRQKDPNSSQTFKSFFYKKVLPEFMSVIFDPTLKRLNGIPLSGFYKFDDEGVPSQKVVSVENGIFKRFLMSRSPIENFPNSNGHGRKNYGYRAVSRQSNLIVESKIKVPLSKLKEMLIEECRKQGKEYGLFFEVVEGGFTFTGRTIPNAFNVLPLVVHKIYVDGRPDEIVRGVDLIGTPLTTFSNIIAAGDDLGVFNGTCGAESGGVLVSACSPSILVAKIEVQKKSKSQEKPPILPSP